MLFLAYSCASDSSLNTEQIKGNKLTPRVFSATWDICRPCSEGNATFRCQDANNSGNFITFTPACGSPTCTDDGSGTLCSQASVTITQVASGSASWNANACALTLPSDTKWSIRQTSSGTCITNGFDWDERGCTASGSIYIKSQVYPTCTPYVTNSTCIQITPR